MSRTRHLLVFLAAIAGLSSLGASADNGAPVALETGAQAPHASVIKDKGWAESTSDATIRWVAAGSAADFSIVRAFDALARRAAGEPLKAVFVVSREAGDYRLLVVREDFLASRPETVERVVGLYERARRWLIAHPQETTALVAQEAGLSESAAHALLAGREFQVSRPGPALAQALRSSADAARTAQVDALLNDGPMRAASRKLEQGSQALLLSQR